MCIGGCARLRNPSSIKVPVLCQKVGLWASFSLGQFAGQVERNAMIELGDRVAA
jgi:hypothetical protein